MVPARKLLLRKESLTPLTGDELGAIAGGEDTDGCVSRILRLCVISGDGPCVVSRVIQPCLTEVGC